MLLPLVGCGSESMADPVGRGLAVRTCDSPGVFAGSGAADWRRGTAHVGPFGMAGSGGNGYRGPNFQQDRFGEDGLMRIKVPMGVEGHRRVELSVPDGQRDRVGFLALDRYREYARMTFVPCRDRKVTAWSAGLVLRDRRPVTVLVRVGGGPVRPLLVGGSPRT